LSDISQGPGWWVASDGKWYAPEQHTAAPPPTTVEPVAPTESEAPAKKSKKVVFQKATYLGGLPGDKGGYSGNLIITDECIGMGAIHPKKSPVQWDEMAGISFDSATMKKSRAGKAVAFGVFALAARKTQKAAEITVQRKDGNVALYTVPGKTGQQVRGKIQQFMVYDPDTPPTRPCHGDRVVIDGTPGQPRPFAGTGATCGVTT
jgi:hypothetical protein